MLRKVNIAVMDMRCMDMYTVGTLLIFLLRYNFLTSNREKIRSLRHIFDVKII